MPLKDVMIYDAKTGESKRVKRNLPDLETESIEEKEEAKKVE